MKFSFAGSLLCLLGIALPCAAQDSEDTTEEVRIAAERDELEPRVPSTVRSPDVQRSTRGEAVMDELILGRSEITGNQELPKVLYIVPWQKPDPGALMGKPVNTLLDEVLAPIDRSEFVRQIDYYDDLHGKQDQ